MRSNSYEAVDHALRAVLNDLLTTIRSSAENVLIGTDPDDIHDLRVATRRTRTVLGQVPGVFPKKVIKPFRRGFKKVGTVTGNCRDLDVWLDAIAIHREAIPLKDADLLVPLESLVRHQRDSARARVANDLVEPWYPELLNRWGAFLHTPRRTESSTPLQPIKTVAAARILKAHCRLLKHGRALPVLPSPAQLHRLRIDGKKLRYLLEFFGNLFDAERCSSLIQDLKGLQNVLGGINDRAIQLQALDGLASDASRLDRSLTAAITLHRHFLEHSLGDSQSHFGDQFDAFINQAVTQSFAELFENL